MSFSVDLPPITLRCACCFTQLHVELIHDGNGGLCKTCNLYYIMNPEGGIPKPNLTDEQLETARAYWRDMNRPVFPIPGLNRLDNKDRETFLLWCKQHDY